MLFHAVLIFILVLGHQHIIWKYSVLISCCDQMIRKSNNTYSERICYKTAPVHFIKKYEIIFIL